MDLQVKIPVQFLNEREYDIALRNGEFCHIYEQVTDEWEDLAWDEIERLQSLLDAYVQDDTVFVNSDTWPNSSLAVEVYRDAIDQDLLCLLIKFLSTSTFICIILTVYTTRMILDDAALIGSIAFRRDRVTMESDLQQWWTSEFGRYDLELSCNH